MTIHDLRSTSMCVVGELQALRIPERDTPRLKANLGSPLITTALHPFSALPSSSSMVIWFVVAPGLCFRPVAAAATKTELLASKM